MASRQAVTYASPAAWLPVKARPYRRKSGTYWAIVLESVIGPPIGPSMLPCRTPRRKKSSSKGRNENPLVAFGLSEHEGLMSARGDPPGSEPGAGTEN